MFRQTVRATSLESLLAGLRLGLFPSSASAEADAAALSRVADWRTVAELALFHHVPGLLLQGLQTVPRLLAASGVEEPSAGVREGPAPRMKEPSAGVREGPAPRTKDLRAAHKRQVLGCMRQLRALRQALSCFAEQGEPCLVLKGLPLSARLYGTPFARRAMDVDLLVDRDSFPACRRMLLARGFRVHPEYRETPVRRRWDAITGKTETLHHGEGAATVAVELHWRLLANPGYIDTTFNLLHERRSSTRVGGVVMPTLGAVDEFVYLMCHGVGHNWRRLKWLADAALLLAAMDEAQYRRVAERCGAARIDAVLESTVGACRAAFHVRPPACGRPAKGRRRAAVVLRSLPRTWRSGDMPPFWWKVPLRLALKPSARFAWHEFLRTLTKPADWRRIDLPDPLFFLYFLLRPLLGLGDWMTNTWRAHWPFPWSRVAGWPRGVEAAALLAVARLLVKHVPMRYWRAWLTTTDTPLATRRPAIAHAIARSVRSVARRRPLNAVCLPQAMAGQWMLRRRGVASRLWLGVRKARGDVDEMEYHAWLTVDGECVLGGGETETFTALPPFDAVPGAKSWRETGRSPHCVGETRE